MRCSCWGLLLLLLLLSSIVVFGSYIWLSLLLMWLSLLDVVLVALLTSLISVLTVADQPALAVSCVRPPIGPVSSVCVSPFSLLSPTSLLTTTLFHRPPHPIRRPTPPPRNHERHAR